MTAPKIDTQAPDVLRDWPEWMDLGKQRCGWSNIAAEPGNMMRYFRADLSAAREAAAYRQGMHDGIDKAANRYRVCASPDVWDYFYTAHNAMLDLKTFEFPAPEGQAALDRLIAERVREAVEARDAEINSLRIASVRRGLKMAKLSSRMRAVIEMWDLLNIEPATRGLDALNDAINDARAELAKGSRDG